MTTLTDQVVIVTGAASGIGRCTARTLAARGARVVLADIADDRAREAATEITADGGTATAVHVDITDPASAERMVASALEAYGRVDALVACAGLDAPHGLPTEIDEAHWRHVIDVDLTGAWWCAKAVLPGMVAQRSGRIVFISSVAARASGAPISPAYGTAKAGLLGLTVALATSLEADGILVNAITPGPTGSTGRPYTAEGADAYLREHPLGFGGPQPIADGVAYLLDSSGDWSSGTVLNISGGNHRGI